MKPGSRKHRGCDAGGWRALCLEHGAASAGLREAGSLTARLGLGGPVGVQLLRLVASRRAPVRDVVLRVGSRAVVYAHTVGNPAALKILRHAGRRPLATVLFTDPRVAAGPLYYRSLDARHRLYRAARPWCDGVPPRSLPARRALFARGTARLLVTEVFLP
jgi:chorismate-pyruvate lyase